MRTVIVNGRVVVDDGKLQTVDPTALLAEARERVGTSASGRSRPSGRQASASWRHQERHRQRVLAEPFEVDSY